MQNKIPEQWKSIVNKLKQSADKHNYKVYIAGGFVRDILLNRQPNDLDITVEKIGDKTTLDSAFEFAQFVAQDYGLNIPQERSNQGTTFLNIEEQQVDFAVPRVDKYYEGNRKPDVAISNLKADALRRDYGQNSLFLDISNNEILDLTGHGIGDINNKIIRVTDIGQEDLIFSQDPLRLLRCIVQATKLNFSISPEVWDAIVRNASKILDISYERIQDEISKILTSDSPAKGINLLRETGLSIYILPEIDELDMEQPEEFHHKNVYEHTLLVLQNVKNTLELRLTALLHDIGKPVKRTITESGIHFYEHEKASADIAKEFLIKLKYPNEVIDTVVFLIYNHMRPHSFENQWTDSAVRRFIRDMGVYLEDIFEIVRADVTSSKPAKIQMHIDMLNKFRERIATVESVAKSTEIKPILNGNDLMKLFNAGAGSWIRVVDSWLLSYQLENPLITKEEAIILLTNAMENGIM